LMIVSTSASRLTAASARSSTAASRWGRVRASSSYSASCSGPLCSTTKRRALKALSTLPFNAQPARSSSPTGGANAAGEEATAAAAGAAAWLNCAIRASIPGESLGGMASAPVWAVR